jgi:transposase
MGTNYYVDIYHSILMRLSDIAIGLVYSTGDIKDVAKTRLGLWYNKVEEWQYPQFSTVIETMKNYYERILNFFEKRHTNTVVESFNAKLKEFRKIFRGVADMKFFLFRVTKLYV